MTHWLIEALQDGLESIEHSELVKRAAVHATIEGEWTPGKIRPSLIAEECRLSRLKKFRGHDAQPHNAGNGAMKSGHPDAATAIHFFRGYMAEGLAVTALNEASRSYQTWSDRAQDGTFIGGHQVSHQGLGLYPFDVMGCSPWTVFEWDSPDRWGPDMAMAEFQAHPDMLISHEGELALVQMKCPSMWAFQRYDREGPESIRKRYEPQAICEMYVARKMGLPVVRNYILVFALEGPLPGSDAAKRGQRVLGLVHPVEWNESGHDRFIEAIAQEILEDDARASSQGTFPPAYPIGTKWPCDYCLYPRVSDVTCEENEKWEPNSSAQPPPFPKDGRQETPSPPPLPTMVLSPAIPLGAPTLPAASSAPASPKPTSPPALPTLTPARPMGPPPLPKS